MSQMPGGDASVSLRAPAQVTIREMTPADVSAGLRLCRLSGWNQLERDWMAFLTLTPGGSRVAEKDGHVVGTVATIRYQHRFSWFSMLLVDPQERRNGIGTQLLSEGLKLLSDQRCVRLDATAAGRTLYEAHGFIEEYQLERMTRPSRSRMPAARSGSIRRIRPQDLASVLERDREIFGADRSDLLRMLFQQAPNFSWIVGDNGIEGYCFSRPGFLYRQLGPVVAKDERLAAALISQCLLEADEPFVVDAPQACPAWLDWLRTTGFLPERTFIRMYRGENTHRGALEYQFGVVGPEFG